MSLGHNPWGTIYWLGHMVLGLNGNGALSLWQNVLAPNMNTLGQDEKL